MNELSKNQKNKEKVNIICLYWIGDFRGRDFKNSDVSRLRQCVDKHLTDRPFEFYCLTNKMDADIPAKKIELKNNWPGWWSKVELFRDDLPEGRILYMDLDSHVVGNLAPILDFEGDLVMFRTPAKKRKILRNTDPTIIYKYQAATILYDANKLSWIYNRFSKNVKEFMKKYRSEQDMYADWTPNLPTFPDEWMTKLQTFKDKKITKPWKELIIITGQPKDGSFRDPYYAPWLNNLAREL